MAGGKRGKGRDPNDSKEREGLHLTPLEEDGDPEAEGDSAIEDDDLTVMAPSFSGDDGDETVMAGPAADGGVDDGATVMASAPSEDGESTPTAPVTAAYTRMAGDDTGAGGVAAPSGSGGRRGPGKRGKYADALPVGHMLMWYEVEKVLGMGGFGVTYKARDTKLDTDVAIKEFLPTKLAGRGANLDVESRSRQAAEAFEHGRADFLEEARTLARFKHENIVRVLTYFEAHGTAYMVMEYEKGRPLSSLLKKKQTLEEPELLSVVMPLLHGLNALHEAGFIHRDIKPDNIFIRNRDGTPVLLDFGAARPIDATEEISPVLTPHYAPMEQYFTDATRQGPWTDIYAMAAVMYQCITGQKPPQAPQRSDAMMRGMADPLGSAVEAGAGRYNQAVLRAVDVGLAVMEDNRPRTINDWLASVDDQDGSQGVSLQSLLEGGDEGMSTRARVAVAAAVAVLVVGVVVTTLTTMMRDEVDLTAAERLQREVQELQVDAADGDVQAMLSLADHYRRGHGFDLDDRQAAHWYTRAAQAGDPEGQYLLGIAYAEGVGVRVSGARAVEWLERAAAQGHAGAAYRLGAALEAGAAGDPDTDRAFHWYREAAERGEDRAMVRLGAAFAGGEGVEKDLDRARELYTVAADAGNAEAKMRLSALYLSGEGVPRDARRGIELERQAADAGLAAAQFEHGLRLLHGDGVEKEPVEALRMLREAADQGHELAQLQVGASYHQGLGVPEEPVRALDWYRAAAEQGNVRAQLELAGMYYYGEGVVRDVTEAAHWLEMAAEQGEPAALNALGAMHQGGTGVARDPVRAVELFRSAAERGNTDAMNSLGAAYESGIGVGRDYTEARRWYRRAAEDGHAEAQRNLAWMAEEGRGGSQNFTEAARWYLAAAEQGDVRAQNTIGWFYEEGRGVEQDLVRAYAWYSLAAARGYGQAVRNLELLGVRLRPEQMHDSQRLARMWLEARSDGGRRG